MSVCSEMLGPSALLLNWPKKSWDLVLSSFFIFLFQNNFLIDFYEEAAFYLHGQNSDTKMILILLFINVLTYLTSMEDARCKK